MDGAPSFESCLELLRGPSDERRFVGLLIARKLCEDEDETKLIRVFDAIGVTFLERLLLPLNHSGFQIDGRGLSVLLDWMDREKTEVQVSMISLAVSLLRTFSIPSIVESNQSRLSSLLPYTFKIWEDKEHLSSTCSSLGLEIEVFENMLVDSLYFVFGVMSENVSGDLFKRCCRMTSLALQHHTRSLIAVQLANSLFEDRRMNDLESQAMDLILHLSYHLIIPDKVTVDEVVKIQLEALKTMDLVFSKITKSDFTDSNQRRTILTNLKRGLSQILESKISSELIHLVLHLIMEICNLIGVEWMTSDSEKDETSNRFITNCAFHTRVELSLLFRDFQSPNVHINGTSTTGDRVVQLLPNYLSLTESLIELLVFMESLLNTHNDAIMDLFRNLDEAIHELVLLIGELENNRGPFLENHPYLLVGCIRLLGRYLAEAPSAHEELVVPLIPFMMSYAHGEAMKFLIPTLQEHLISKSSTWEHLWTDPKIKNMIESLEDVKD